MARTCPSEPHGGEVGLTAKMDWTSLLKALANNTLIMGFHMLPITEVDKNAI